MGNLTNFLNEIANKYVDYWCANEIPNPKVSVIVPAYNVEKYIEDCLASLVKQSFKDFEVIVINDGSTDLTPEIANVFQHCDKRFKLISQSNRKPGAARNKGMEVARGEYIGFVDSDDYVDEYYYEKLYNTAKKYDSDIALADYIRVGNGKTKKRLNITDEILVTTLEEKFSLCEQAKNPCPTNKIYKSSLLKKNGITFPEDVYCEDKIFTCKAVFYANSVVSVPNTNYYYYRRNNSIVKTHDKQHLLDKINANRFVLDFLKLNNVKLKNDNFWAIKNSYSKFGILWYQIKENLTIEKHLLFGIFTLKQGPIDYFEVKRKKHKLLEQFKRNNKQKIEIENFYSSDYLDSSNIDIITTTFNNPNVVDYQIKLIKINLIGKYRHIICDNSNDIESAIKIKNICEKNNISYIRVKIDTPSGYSDSYGRALNWIYKNIVLKRRNNFAFIDHDIFPIKQIYVEDYLKNNDLYGFIRTANKIWFLWPTFSFFKFDFVKNKKLNFRKYKKFGIFHYKGADTGSGLWSTVYKNYNLNLIPKVSCDYVDIIDEKSVNIDDLTGYESYIQTNLSQYIDSGSWFHSICGSEWRADVQAKNKKIYKMLDENL